MFATMKIKGDRLVVVKSIFDPNIVLIKDVVKQVGRSRQFIEGEDLTFGIIESVEIKVIIIDEKYTAFLEKCSKIDQQKNEKKFRDNGKGRNSDSKKRPDNKQTRI